MKPEYETRPLTRQEMQAYIALLTSKLPEQLEVSGCVGISPDALCILIDIKGKPNNVDRPTILTTVSEVTNFLNFLAIQEEIAREEQ